MIDPMPAPLPPRRCRARLRASAPLLGLAILLHGCGDDDGPRATADPERGAELYGAHCVSCHGGPVGGDISDIPPRHNAEGHTWHHGDCELVDIVLDGLPPREGHPPMPAFGDRLDEQDVHDILAHIRTWWEPDQREHQQQVTDQVCG